MLTTSTSSLTAAVVLAGVFGLFAGTCYVSGFTVIQERVVDCAAGPDVRHAVHDHPVLPAAVAGRRRPGWPACSTALSGALTTDRIIDLGIRIRVPGVRLTFWLGGFMTVAAGVVVSRDMLRARGRNSHPTNGD